MAGVKPQYITEKKHVEDSFLAQLKGLGWEVLTLDMHHQKPAESWRDSFDAVVLLPKLREALARINDWLDDEQIEEAVGKIVDLHGGDLLANNQHVLRLLLEGTTTDRNRKTGEVSPTVRYVDFDRRDNNSFVALCQFKVRIPGTDRHIVPDITLFLNACPSPSSSANRRRSRSPSPMPSTRCSATASSAATRGKGTGGSSTTTSFSSPPTASRRRPAPSPPGTRSTSTVGQTLTRSPSTTSNTAPPPPTSSSASSPACSPETTS
jgi:type I restriction enzyme, R subunit